ncbi:MAG: hypothetical protein NC218_06710 [Acetobacter sp.]|nr:hypothetical protein [Acetobacter sp.]
MLQAINFTPDGATTAQKQTIAGFTANNATVDTKQKIIKWGTISAKTGVSKTMDTQYTAEDNLWLYASLLSGAEGGGSAAEINIEVNGTAIANLKSFEYNACTVFVLVPKGCTYKFKNIVSGYNITRTFKTYKCTD